MWKKMKGREGLEVKVCLYVLRFLLCLRWLERKQTLPPTRLAVLAEEVLPEDAMHRWMNEILTRRTGRVEIVPREHVPIDWIDGELKRLERAVKGWPQGRDATPEVEKVLLRELGFC
jgi:predicted nucleotidyltransferase